MGSQPQDILHLFLGILGVNLVVPGGFGERGSEGKISAIRYAREQKVPYFGICLGMQLAVVEHARHCSGQLISLHHPRLQGAL